MTSFVFSRAGEKLVEIDLSMSKAKGLLQKTMSLGMSTVKRVTMMDGGGPRVSCEGCFSQDGESAGGTVENTCGLK